MSIHFIDSHAHLTDDAFDDDRDAVVAQSFAAGTRNIIEIGCETGEWRPALDLAAKYDGKIFAALGLHPSCAGQYSESAFAELRKLLDDKRVVAIGEIGLDYIHMSTTIEQQQEIFAKTLDITKEVKKPIILHARKNNINGDYGVYEDLFRVLKQNWNASSGGVLHCFSGRYQDAKAALDTGLKLGINGIITYKKNNDLRETMAKAGLQNILLETDCPYLPPQRVRGKRNTPAYIPEIALFIADYLNIPIEKVAEITTQNSIEMFDLK